MKFSESAEVRVDWMGVETEAGPAAQGQVRDCREGGDRETFGRRKVQPRRDVLALTYVPIWVEGLDIGWLSIGLESRSQERGRGQREGFLTAVIS